MSFFTDKSEFTHRASLCGVPCYIKDLDSEGPSVAGTNAIFDWMLLWWPQTVAWCANTMAGGLICLGLMDEDDYEPAWAICIKGKL